ncbi:ATP-binding protein [Desulfovibrio inopinatus]|uniref:ATP-binding protein n=1 Tax=Desulfovibrio inopinatus TaxID=102109 RepID=UPI000420209F|nr:ATP-binding protein [Desulfovibrio inopinatus]
MTIQRLVSSLSFRTKINLGIAAIVLMLGIVTALVASTMAKQYILDEVKKRGAALARNLATEAAEPILAVDYFRLQAALEAIIDSGDDVVYAFVLDESGGVLSSTFVGGFPVDLLTANSLPATHEESLALLESNEGDIYDFAARSKAAGVAIGIARIGLSKEAAMAGVNRMAAAIMAATGTLAALAIIIGTVFSASVTRRINVLRQAAERIVMGDLDQTTGLSQAVACWEIMDCNLTRCPAYGDSARRCWHIAGALYPDSKGTHGDGCKSCHECVVYKNRSSDEIQSLAEAFDAMALALRTHIRELEKTQRDLAGQSRLLKTILDVTPDLVSLQNEHLEYRAVNRAFCDFVGKPPEAIMGKRDEDLFSASMAARNRKEDEEILRTGRMLSKQITVLRDGNKRWFHIVKVPVYDRERLMGLLLTARDVSVVKQYEEQLIQSQKMEDLGKLAGGVAHEINTPLGVILGYAQLLQEDVPAEGDIARDLKIIEKQAKVCRKIVADLLGFSRNAGSDKGMMNVNDSIFDVVSLVDHIFRQDRIRLHIDLADNPPMVDADREKLKQVWINLLNNARDAIGQDGDITIVSRPDTDGSAVIVTVSDTGEGIRQADLARIFDPFFSTKSSGQGTGLGLAVSFGIIREHGGTIAAVSPAPVASLDGNGGTGQKQQGPGAMFTVRLPAAKDNES